MSTCELCGEPLDTHQHERDVQFRLPAAVLALPEQEETAGTWMSADDVARAAFLEVPGAGAFVRSLLPIRLTQGYHVTFGVWLAVSTAVLREADRVWAEPEYEHLVIPGRLANRLPVWGLLDAPATATVVDVDTKPVITATDDPTLHRLLTEEWPHEELIAALPPL